MQNSKPERPNPEFPLYAHNAGYWAKKINGKTRYFGPWDDPEGALINYQRERKAWESGQNPREKIELKKALAGQGLLLGDALNLFLEATFQRVERGELTLRSYLDYKATSEKILKGLDRREGINALQPDDWAKVYLAIAKGKGNTTIANEITRIKVMMNWLLENRYLDREPHYGSELTKPSKVAIRRSRANTGKKWFSSEEINTLLTTDHLVLRAMILLGINCGYGNGDCSQLQLDWIDLKRGWIEYARPKTGVDRRAKLWPETITAITTWLDKRPRINNSLVFVTRQGNAWSDPDSADCAIAKAFKRISEEKKVYIAGRGFYGLRRTFETIAGRTKDQVAVDFIMGHVDQSMAGIYRQEIDDSRLTVVSEFVRNWVYMP
jgi:integrase